MQRYSEHPECEEPSAAGGARTAIEIRSYRRVFALERRLYRIDRLRLNPAGVPLRGIAYCAALLVVAALVSRVPLLGGVVRILPWYLREVLVPALAAALLTIIEIEGRPFHVAAVALLRYRLTASQRVGVRPRRDLRRLQGP
jgi:hypothetical protein